MENITQENIDRIVSNFGQLKIQFEKLEGIVGDLNNCQSEYTKNILVSAISKFSEQIGLKDRILKDAQ